jgi:hypothetical protein
MSGDGRISPSRRFAQLLSAAVLSAAALPSSAQTGLARVGPLDPVTGFPRWYEDTNGLKLGMCDDPNFCFFVAPDPLRPVKFPAFDGDPTANFPDEFFYYALNGSLNGVNGARGTLVIALEGAFAGGAVKLGDQIVFARVRLRITNLVDGATYTVTHPYGVETLVAGDGALPGEINITRDIGIGAPGDFTGALHGDIGPFVTPVGFLGGPQGTFIADGVTAVPVQGSPVLVAGLPANFWRIEGPNVGLAFPANVSPNPALGPDPTTTTDCVQLDVFTLQGQIARQFGVTADRTHYAKSATQTAVNVWASSASGQLLQASIDGGAAVSLVENGTTGQYFVRAELGVAAPRPTTVTVVNTSDNPPTQVTRSLSDLVTISSASFVLGGSLNVQADTTDLATSPVLSASVPGLPAVVMIPSGQGISVGSLNLGASFPPATVTVTSSQGGSATVPVRVTGIGTPVDGATLIANAGADRTLGTGVPVTLDGTGSVGPIASFAWTHNAGATITLVGANTATPSFTTPLVAAPLDITFTLTVANAGATLTATDSVIIRVTPPPPADVLTINVARYLQNKRTWRIDGTSSVLSAHTVNVYLGNVGDTTRRIGTATVDALGGFRLVLADNSAVTTNTVPGVGDVSIWASSSLGGTPAVSGFQLR